MAKRKLSSLIITSLIVSIFMISCANRPTLKNYSEKIFVPTALLDSNKWCHIKRKDLLACRELGKIDTNKTKIFKVPTYGADRYSIRYNEINKNIYIIVATAEMEILLPQSPKIDTAIFAAEIDSVNNMYYYSFSGGDAAYRFEGKENCCD